MRGWLTVGPAALAVLVMACSSEEDKVPAGAQAQTMTFGDRLQVAPPSLTVQAGKPVVLTIKNIGAVDQDFHLRDMPVRDRKNAVKGVHGGHGESGTVVGHRKAGGEVAIHVTPTATGGYESWCSVTGHKDAAMVG